MRKIDGNTVGFVAAIIMALLHFREIDVFGIYMIIALVFVVLKRLD